MSRVVSYGKALFWTVVNRGAEFRVTCIAGDWRCTCGFLGCRHIHAAIEHYDTHKREMHNVLEDGHVVQWHQREDQE